VNELCVRKLATLVVFTCGAIGLGLCWGAHKKPASATAQPTARAPLAVRSSLPAAQSQGGPSINLQRNEIADTARRSAADFSEPESVESDAPSLSKQVSPQDRELIAAAWKAGDFVRVAQLISKLANLEDRRVLWPSLLEAWVRLNPAGALAFVGSLERGAERREWIGAAVRLWAARDLEAASSWVNALPIDRESDPAIAAIALCPALYQQSHDTALLWAETVVDPKLRWEAICTVAQDWARRDANAAEAYLVNCRALTSEERSQAIAHVRRWSVAVK
jgi:hypothetical protein